MSPARLSSSGRLMSLQFGRKGCFLPSFITFLSTIFLVTTFHTTWAFQLQKVHNLNDFTPSVVRADSASLRNDTAPLLDVIQVYTPVKIPVDTSCSQKLMEYSFGWSYDKPFFTNYTPPACQFNRVVINYTVTSAGRQFDRLALMYLGDTEVWRTSTAEPTLTGIVWTYSKDLSEYLALWKQPQTLIFDLGNLIDETYTAPFNTTLTATFFTTEVQTAPADLIIPVSRRLSSQNAASAYRIPDQGRALNKLSIPRNVKKAVFTISACGQGDEEFWWSNVPQSATTTFRNATMGGFSPWREVQLFIDDKLAGVVWPFPIIFTGGVVPLFWRPLVGIDAYDMKEDEIDITPWLPMLSDGQEHSYEIRVVGITDDALGRATISTVASNWVVTGKLFLWLDVEGSITTGDMPTMAAPEPQFLIEQGTKKGMNGTNLTLTYQVMASREFTVEAAVRTSEGSRLAGWKQSLTFSNIGFVTARGNNQTNDQTTTATGISSSGYSRKVRYPLRISSFAKIDPVSKAMTLGGNMTRGQWIQTFGTPVFPSGLETFNATLNFDNRAPSDYDGFTIDTFQAGNASYESRPGMNTSIGAGQTEQRYNFLGEKSRDDKYPYAPAPDQSKELYRRNVVAKNGKIIIDTDRPTQAAIRIPAEQYPVADVLGPQDLQKAVGTGRYRQIAANPTQIDQQLTLGLGTSTRQPKRRRVFVF